MVSTEEFNRAKGEESWRKSKALADQWTEQEITEAGLDANSPEAAFHRFMANAFGTMGVMPLEKKPTTEKVGNG